jgi:uncharacterized protein YndB with AHSA1/START domain
MTTDFGTITPCYTLMFHRQSRQPAQRLWEAITNAAEVTRWMGYPVRVDLRVGGEWSVDFAATGGGSMESVITRVEPGRVLAYAWGRSVVEWTIAEEEAGGCRYRFVQSGLADRGEDEEGLIAGWHEFLDRLGDYLEGRGQLEYQARVAAWAALKPTYLEQLDRVFALTRGQAPEG